MTAPDPPPLAGVRLLWDADYWDGPLSGLALYGGREHWFEVEPFDPDDPPPVRTCRLYELADEEIAEEQRSQWRFRELFGLHSDYDEDGWQLGPAALTNERQEAFYAEEAKRPRVDYAAREPIGRFAVRFDNSLRWRTAPE